MNGRRAVAYNGKNRMSRNASGLAALVRKLFGPAGLLSTLPYALFILAQGFLIKRAMLLKAGSLLSEFDTFRASRVDVMLFGVFAFISAMLISASRRPLRGLFICVYSGAMFVAGIYQLANLAYYEGTGAALSREVLSYWFKNMGENRGLIASEARPDRLVLVGIQVLALVLCLLLPWLKRARRWAERNTGAPGVLAAYLVGAIVLEAYSFVPPLADVHPALEPWAPNEGFLGGQAGEQRLPKDFVILEDARMDGRLVLEKDPAVPARNVVLIIFESLNWKNSDVYTPGKGTTPFLAELARRGAVIDRLYTVVPHTTKALVSILCGIYPYLEPEVKESVPRILPERGLAHLLRKEGYATAFFQTANNYESRNQVVANMGFETFKGVFDMPAEGFSDTNYFGKEERMMLGPSLEWVDAQRGRPFFLTYLTLCTHHDYETPATWPIRDFGVSDKAENQYLNAVRYTDEFIKEVMAGFRKRGLDKDTLFIIVGDHGEAFMEHGAKGHNMTLYEEGLRALGLVYAPGLVAPNEIIPGYRSILDIVPTACDALGLRVREGRFIGKSLFRPVPADRALHFSAWSRRWGLAMREGPVKTIFWPMKMKFEVFDNETDPFDAQKRMELLKNDRNGSGDPGGRMEHWADTVNAQYLEWERATIELALAEAPRLLNPVQGSFDGLVSVFGYEAYPEATYRERNIWIKIGLRSDARILRPLVLMLRFEHPGGRSYSWQVPVQALERYDQLAPGMYFTTETFLRVPVDWPLGGSDLFVGVQDKRSRRDLAVTEAGGRRSGPGAGIRLRTLQVLE